MSKATSAPRRIDSTRAMPTTLFHMLNARCKGLLEEGRKEVYKNALVRMKSDVRHSRLGDDIVAFNLGSYLLSPTSLIVLYLIVKEYDDHHRRKSRSRLLTYDEAWDEMGPFIQTFMKGFVKKHNLNPVMPCGTFVSLV